MRASISLLLALFFTILTSGMAYAVPTLQLDIVGGDYRNADDTIVSSGDIFRLVALLNDSTTAPDVIASKEYYISAAVVIQNLDVENRGVQQGGNLGSFTFGGKTINVTSDMVYGAAPIERLNTSLQGWDSGDLSRHGIFETYFTEFKFTFDPTATIGAYDTATDRSAPGTLYSRNFLVDVSGLNAGYEIHFDLYNEKIAKKSTSDLDANDFAPFSHDAESGTTPVPEPATLMLVGSGLLGLAGFRKKIQK